VLQLVGIILSLQASLSCSDVLKLPLKLVILLLQGQQKQTHTQW
jgi:hypothetical protein